MIKDVEPLLKECEETLAELMRMGNVEVACYVQGFINSINKLPDVEERPHGEWMPLSEPYKKEGDERMSMCNKCVKRDCPLSRGRETLNVEKCIFFEEKTEIERIELVGEDLGERILICPDCECTIKLKPYDQACGTKATTFCPYCGADMRKEGEAE